ncbi:phosphatidate cytidylyltransferase [Saccharicrinis aurantiacus]|uniref:phosphatidate cytidylyltransferase n=1 Tax=Saccharicrinis aurantiacus TaxID=1849719 RepID=UPI000838DEC8|nr:phosphatidate cytidylyltransferase [Saccharicrinis aurantiacus]
MNNFWQRTITGILFVLIIAGGIFYSPVSFFVVFFAVVILGTTELHKLLKGGGIEPSFFLTVLLSVFVYVASFLVNSGISDPKLFFLLIPISMGIFITELYRKKNNPIGNIGGTLLIALLIAVPFSLLSKIAYLSGTYNFRVPLIIFILVWLNDTGAYLFGVSLGKHRLFERISPKKSWEGAIGGFMLTLFAAGEIYILWPAMSLIHWLVLSALISVVAIYGDLSESLLKRSLNAKDSGNLLPGHGGVLDRFDAVLFAIPITLFFLIYFVN